MIAHISDDGQFRTESVAEHTRRTADLCAEKGKRCDLSQVMALCGIYHDLGKCKQAFNDYIRADEQTKKQLKGTIAHAPTGAKYFYEQHQDCSGSTWFMVDMIAYAVAAHHGLFDCVDAEHIDRFSNKLDVVADYEEACSNAQRDYLRDYDLDRIFADASGEFQQVWNRIKQIFNSLKPLLLSRQDKNNEEKYEMLNACKYFLLACLQRLLLSMLIDSDWEATSEFMNRIDPLSKPAHIDTIKIFERARKHFERYIQEKQRCVAASVRTAREKAILDARIALQKECTQFAKHPAGVYCLPIPTGGGKTLAGIAYALEYCNYHPETERIIYVAPYISITEQNAQVFREAIGNDEWLLEHHSSVVRNEGSESEDYRRSQCQKFEINWEEPFICTTFVQFMNTLFSDQSASIRRMHRLVNSVVIIDEVQSMPLKCVHTFNYMINFLVGVCNTSVILCTATQPALADTGCPICYSEPKDMIENASDWFRKFERVHITTPENDQKYTFETLGDEIAERMEEYASILVVLNTKSAVRKLYDHLKERKVPVEYLTTNLCAEHRSDKIKSIKEILDKKQEPIVVVSTNLIEAGVDISFACVYRSMTGLDSLAQTAGRCNRNGEMECGEIRLIMLEGENTGNMAEQKQKERVAASILFQYKGSEGTESLLMPEWMDKYYKQMYSYASDKMNFPIEELDTNVFELLSLGFGLKEKKHEMNQAYRTAGQAYQVIDDHSFGVIVPYRRGAEIIEALQNTSDIAEIKAYIRQAQRYTVNVRENQLKKFSGLIQPVSERIPGIYMAAVPGAYRLDCGISSEWETLIY